MMMEDGDDRWWMIMDDWFAQVQTLIVGTHVCSNM